MADLTIVAASVVSGVGATFRDGIAGGTITQGMPVYEDASDAKKWKAADANVSAAAAAVIGIALNSALAGQPLRIQTGGIIAIGSTVAIATIYILSANAGMIAPSSDSASTWFTTILGVALTTTTIQLAIKASGVAKP